MSDYISEDSLVQILKWLPVKPLLRFRSVCKWWRHLIDSQPFIQEHLALRKPIVMADNLHEAAELFVVDPRTIPSAEAVRYPTYPFEVDPELGRLRLVNTLHGVVLLYNSVAKNLVLWNPSIRKFFSLSLPEIMQFEWLIPGGLVVEAHSSFWIDPSNYSFKIIAFKLHEGSVDGVIYSSIERGWKLLPLDDVRSCRPFLHPNIAPPVMIMIGGVAYWRARNKAIPTTVPVVLVSFDFVQERFEIIETPQLLHMNYTGLFPPLHCNLHGTLSLVYWDSDGPFRCDIYSMQEGGWVNMFHFKVGPEFLRIFWLSEVIQGRCRVVAEIGGNEGPETTLVSYDSGDGRIITLKSELKYPFEIQMVYDFVESLVFPSP